MSPERTALIRAVALLTHAKEELEAFLLEQAGDDFGAAQIIDNIGAFLMGPAPQLGKGELFYRDQVHEYVGEMPWPD